ncbi:MAG: nuclear transport factor 2 family protein [Pyrinomonadaceae bacterium]
MSTNNKNIVNEVNEAFANNRPEDFLKHCADNIEWQMVGEKTTKGINEIRAWMAQMKDAEPPKFTIDEIISEGDSVVCLGDMNMKGEDGKPGNYSYCDVYNFNNGKIARLQSFVVKLKAGGEKSAAA